MSLEDFLNACELGLKRAKVVLNQPLVLQTELVNLDELLRNQWPDAMKNIQENGLRQKDEERITLILNEIKKLEVHTKTRQSLFDGIESFLQESRNR